MRRFATLAIALISLLALGAGPAMAWADHEGSNRPQDIFSEPINETWEDEFLSETCGAPIEIHVEGTSRTRWTYNRGLDIQFDTHTWMVHGSWTNTETGDTVTFVDVGSDRLAFEVLPNGDYTGIVTNSISRNFMATAPGVGRVMSSGGHEITYDVHEVIDQETFDWRFVSREVLFPSTREAVENLEALCDALTASG